MLEVFNSFYPFLTLIAVFKKTFVDFMGKLPTNRKQFPHNRIERASINVCFHSDALLNA